MLVPVLAAAVVSAFPRIRVARDTGAALRMGLPSNATSIRSDEMLSEKFSCAGRHYGYYADPDNDCQLFHVCLPVQFDDGRGSMYKWSFVCPEDTVFNQETFTCSRREDAINCQDSERFYGLNEDLGVSRKQLQQQQQQQQEEAEEAEPTDDSMAEVVEDVPYQPAHAAVYPHAVERPTEARPPPPQQVHQLHQQADSAMQQQQQQQQLHQASTDPLDDGVSKYGAFTTIRY